MERYNLVIVGGGSAGLMVAAGAAGLGARVALVERGPMGGDCLNYGCVPSKALLRTARLVAETREARLGIEPAEPAHPWSGVTARVQRVIDTIAPHDSRERFESLGVDVLAGQGRLTGPTTVAVSGVDGEHTLHARAVVLATGSGPLVPDIPGLADAGYQTNETVFTMPEQPRRLLVLGGGPIGVELGQAMARLGSEVTLVEMAPRLVPREDADAAEVLQAALERDGVRLRTGRRLTAVEAAGGVKRASLQPADGASGEAETVEVDDILLAVGRRPALEGLGLEAAGVSVENGFVRVDERLRTTAPGVYACGDCAGPYLFTHTANQQARVVIQNALLPFRTRMDYRVIPWCTFTEPEIARVGLNETDARAGGTPYRTVTVPFSGIDRAVCDDATEGFLKVLTPPGRDDILGATLVGANAGEMVHEIILAMKARLKLRHLAGTIHIYPTMAEIFRRAGDESRKAGFTPRMQALLRGYLRWRRR